VSERNNDFFEFDDSDDDDDFQFEAEKTVVSSQVEGDDELLDEYLFQKKVPFPFKIFVKDIELSKRNFFFIAFIINSIMILLILQVGIAIIVLYIKGDDPFNFASILIGGVIGVIIAYKIVDRINTIINFFKYFICLSLVITIIQLFLGLSQIYGGLMNGLFVINAAIIIVLYVLFFKYYLLKTSILERGRIYAYQFLFIIMSFVILIASLYLIFLLLIPLSLIIASIIILHINRETGEKFIKKSWKLRKRRINTAKFVKFYFFIAFFGLTAGFATPYGTFIQVITDVYTGNVIVAVLFVGLFLILGPIMAGLIFDYFGRTGALSFIILAVALSNYSNVFGIEGIPIAVVFISYVIALMSIPLLVGDMTTHDNYGRMLSVSNFFLVVGIGTGIILRGIIEVSITDPIFANSLIISTTFMVCIACVIILANMQETLPRMEQDWKESLFHLYIVHHSGMLLYEYAFIKDYEETSPDLISGGIVGLISLLKEIVRGEKQVKTIDHEDRKIMFKSNEHNNVYFALVVEEELLTFRNKLDGLIKDFDERFTQVVKEISQSGVDQDDFLDLKYYVRRYFGV